MRPKGTAGQHQDGMVPGLAHDVAHGEGFAVARRPVQQQAPLDVLAAGAEPFAVVGDGQHLAFHQLQSLLRQDQLVAGQPRPRQEHDRPQPHMAHVGLSEREHLLAEDVALDHQAADLGQQGSGPFLVRGEDLQRHRLLRAVFAGAAHEPHKPRVPVVDEEQAELHTGQGLVGAHGQVGKVHRSDLDPELVRRVHKIGEGLEVALVATQAHQLMSPTVCVEVGGQGDLDVDVIIGREGVGDDWER
jgi:hypothetical protein